MKLKHYATYYNKLLDFSKAVNVMIYTKSNYNNASYSPSKRYIIIDDKMGQAEQIASLLHELGHFLDDVDCNYKYDDVYSKAVDRMNKDKALGKIQFLILMRCETMAWQKGEVLARMLAIPLGKWYKRDKVKSLTSYFEIKTFKGVKR